MHISSVFYAIMDMMQGPRIVYQVPEDLITSPPRMIINAQNNTSLRSVSGLSETSSSARGTDTSNGSVADQSLSSATSADLESPLASPLYEPVIAPSMRSIRSQSKISTKSNTVEIPLFEWELVAQFVVPRTEMCNRLTISTTKKHRIVGFPVVLMSDKYERGTFQFNVCFVFKRETDVTCFEPVVRKIARVLTVCEKNQSFLSSPRTSERMYPILEQLFADLNSFSETSIRIDSVNSIELRIFSHYPNPKPVHSWDVPVPLIDIASRAEPNWDLTMRKIIPFINGVDHVQKIAQKAEADITLVKECMSQVLMYQCIMMIDIFQFSNFYTLCKPVSWLFTDPAVYEECGPYIHKGKEKLPWPRLAWLYARLKPPLTVGMWINQYNVDLEQIDVRRFVTFGVIKGFLRRVHRYPILLKDDNPMVANASYPKRRNKSMVFGGGEGDMSGQRWSVGNELELVTSNLSLGSYPSSPPPLGSSAMGLTLQQPANLFQSPPPDDLVSDSKRAKRATSTKPTMAREETLRPEQFAAAVNRKRGEMEVRSKHSAAKGGISASIPNSYVSPTVLKNRMNPSTSADEVEDDPRAASLPVAEQLAEQALAQGKAVANKHPGRRIVEIPSQFTEFLDGTHHSDELCVHFHQSWNVLLETLVVVGGGTGEDGDLGRVVILLR